MASNDGKSTTVTPNVDVVTDAPKDAPANPSPFAGDPETPLISEDSHYPPQPQLNPVDVRHPQIGGQTPEESVENKTKGEATFKVTLHQNRQGDMQLPDCTPQINGVITAIRRGVPVEVSESVYQLLVAAGEVAPQRPEDEKLVPVNAIRPGVLSDQRGAPTSR